MYDEECYFNLEIGKTYKVSGKDCCIEAEFISKLTNLITPGDYTDEEVHFENGVSIKGFGWVIEEAD